MFHQDNAPFQTSGIAMAKTNELQFELLIHSPYSSGLVPADYFLYPNSKKCVGGKRYASNKESSVDGYFEVLNYLHYKQSIEAIEQRQKNCIGLKEDYLEK